MYLAVTSPISGEAFALILRTRGVGQQGDHVRRSDVRRPDHDAAVEPGVRVGYFRLTERAYLLGHAQAHTRDVPIS